MKRMPLPALAVIAAGAMLLAPAGAASATKKKDPPPPTISSTPSGPSNVDFQGSQNQTQTTGGTPGGGGSPAPSGGGGSGPAPDALTPAEQWAQAFPIGGVRDPSGDYSWMPGAVDACGSNWGGDGWNAGVATATPCAPGEDPETPTAPVITTAMVIAAARATAPQSPPHVEPGNQSYVHIPNNYWTDAPTVNTSITLLGQRIPLRWAPTGTTWSFGDGATASGNGVKGADVGAPGALEHSYGRQGRYAISTSTTYNLTFTIPGAGAQTLQLVAPPSPPVVLPVSEIQTRVDYVR